MKDRKKLLDIFFETASPEERLAYEKKQLEKKLAALAEVPPDTIKGEPGTPGAPGAPGKDGSPDSGEQIVAKINELEIVPEKQIDFPHIKGFPWHLLKKGENGIITWGNPIEAAIIYVIDGGGSAITTGVKGDLYIPFICNITEVTLLADQSGSIVIDIWKDTYGNFAPTVADTIVASAKPTIAVGIKSQDNTLTGWNKTIEAGDSLRFNVDSITSVTRLTICLKVTRR